MKYQPTKKTDQLLQLEALVPRLKRSHPAYSELYHTFGKDLSGYYGERNLRYYFEFIDSVKGVHLSGLRLRGSTFFTQLDHLIMTARVLFIIEVKNRKGLILKNQHGQYVQEYDRERVTFDNPENQAAIQARQLDYILRRHGLPAIPIVWLVAFPHKTVQLDSSITSPNVMVAQETSFFINDHLKKTARIHYNDHQLNQTKRLLEKLHEPRLVNLIGENNIQREDFNTGVLCSRCRSEFVERNYATWTCARCGLSDSRLHIQALRDYAHLFEPKINNRTARWWMGVECTGLTYRLLSEFPVVNEVGRKAVEYDLSSLLKNNF